MPFDASHQSEVRPFEIARDTMQPRMPLFKAIIVIAAIDLIYFAQVFNLVGAGALARTITGSIGGTGNEVWFAGSITIATVVLCPPVSQAADYWGRKWLVSVLTICGGVGSIIVSRAQSIDMAIAGFDIGGLSHGAQALLHAIPSEIMPRRYRSLTQASVQIAAALGGITGLLVGGKLTRNDLSGFRTYFYIDAGFFFTASVACLLLYNPPKREHQSLPIREKVRQLDLIGYISMATGLILFCVGLSWSQNPYDWRDAHVYAPFVVGIMASIAFIVFEIYKKTGMLHKDLFRDRNFPIALGSLFVEGLVFFSVNNYLVYEIGVLFPTDPLQNGLHFSVVFFALSVSALMGGAYSSARKIVRLPSIIGFSFFVVFCITMATVNTKTPSAPLWGYPVLVGIGLGVCLVVLVTAAQFAAPVELIAISSGLIISARSLGGSIGLAIYNAILNHSMSGISNKIAAATIPLGLPAERLGPFIEAMLARDQGALSQIPGVTPEISSAAGSIIVKTYVDGFRNIWIAAGAFAVVALFASCFLKDPEADFNGHIDAPIHTVSPTIENHIAEEPK